MGETHEYGEIVAIPLTIQNEQGKKEEVQIYSPIKETPQFVSLLEIIKKWVVDDFNIDDVIPLSSKIMAVVNQAVCSKHAGAYKKKLVLSLMYCCVKVSDLLMPEKNIAYSIISHVAPSAIDTMVAIAKGQIDIKQSLHYVEKNCWSFLASNTNWSMQKNNELSNVIYEHKQIDSKEKEKPNEEVKKEEVNEESSDK